jgi:hypothetical protein
VKRNKKWKKLRGFSAGQKLQNQRAPKDSHRRRDDADN